MHFPRSAVNRKLLHNTCGEVGNESQALMAFDFKVLRNSKHFLTLNSSLIGAVHLIHIKELIY